MRYTKTISILLAAVLALAATGCGSTDNSSAASTAGSSAAVSEAAAAPLRDFSSDPASNGFYGTDFQNNHLLLTWVDLKSGVSTPLCAQPGCAHSDDSCTAFIPDGTRCWPVGTDTQDRLFLSENCPDGSAFQDQLVAAQPDGGNRKVLWKASSGQNLESVPCFDADSLYLLISQPDVENGRGIYRLSKNGGNAELVFHCPETVLGSFERSLVLLDFSWNNSEMVPMEWEAFMKQEGLEDRPDWEQKEHYSAYLDSCMADDRLDYRVFLKDVDTGAETELCRWSLPPAQSGLGGEPDAQILWQDGCLYWMDQYTPGPIYCQKPGEEKRILNVNWPAELPPETEVSLTFETVLDGRLLLNVYGPWGSHESHRFAVELSTGAVSEIPLLCLGNGHSYPVPILAVGTDRLLVEIGYRENMVVTTMPDMAPELGTELNSWQALISFEDFFAGQPVYQDLTAS